MGVRNLETFLETHSKHSCFVVSIPKIVENYRIHNNNATPVIVVDGMSCLRPIYSQFSWINGGQYKEFYEIVQSFIDKFTKDLGCQLVVYFDGPVQKNKLNIWKKRRLMTARDLSYIFNKLDEGSNFNENSFRRGSCLPNGIGWIFIYLMSQNENCRVFNSIKECDEEIARYALKNKCLAILAQDTDYVIYRGALYYLSIKHLNLNNMTTLCYDGFKLCAELGIKTDYLPLLASLLGNDIVDFDSLSAFHHSLRTRSKFQKNLIILVADFIKNLKSINFLQIASRVFGCIEKAELLKLSVSSYDILSSSSELEETIDVGDQHWQKIIKLCKKKSAENPYPAPLYDILINGQFFSSACLEDYRDKHIIKPVGNILKELRRSIYGILFHEKPTTQGSNIVHELVMTGFLSMTNFVEVRPKYLVKVKHPGLMKLWTSKEKYIEDIKWNIIAEVFEVELSEIKYVPPWCLIPALSARYFKDQFPDVFDWEMNALIACTVCVQDYDIHELAKLPLGPLTSRQVWLYTALTRIFSTVVNLFYYIDHPLPLAYTLPSSYTDGKLFHEKYRNSRKEADIQSLCEYKEQNVNMFELLQTFIVKEKKILPSRNQI